MDFDPARGGEITKRRLAVIVSNDAAVHVQSRVQIVPLTTNVNRVFRWEALVHAGSVPHKALADQIRTVAKGRLQEQVGSLSATDMLAVERAIRVQLGLP